MNTSLNGLRILNTRPNQQGQTLSQTIRAQGGVAIDCPLLEIQATNKLWLKQLPNLKTVYCAIFISANAVNYSLPYISNWPKSIKVIAIGQATALALAQKMIVSEVPRTADSEHLLSLSSLSMPANKRIILFKGEGGRLLIEEELKKQQAHLTIIPVYQRVTPTICEQFIISLWQDDALDIILLTSEQSIHTLFNVFKSEMQPWLQTKTYLVISKRLAHIATNVGLKKIIVSPPDQIIDTLLDYRNKTWPNQKKNS